MQDGGLYSFGDNSDGQCSGFSTRYSTPNKIGAEISGKIVDIKCGYNHCMIINGKFFHIFLYFF
jgi:hypothetical protein